MHFYNILIFTVINFKRTERKFSLTNKVRKDTIAVCYYTYHDRKNWQMINLSAIYLLYHWERIFYPATILLGTKRHNDR